MYHVLMSQGFACDCIGFSCFGLYVAAMGFKSIVFALVGWEGSLTLPPGGNYEYKSTTDNKNF